MREKLSTRNLFVLILLTLWTFIPSAVQAQASETVTLDLKQTSIEHLFSQIKKQTGYSFIISSDLAHSLKRVDVKAQNEPVKKVLDRVLDTQNCTYDIDGRTITVFRKVSGNRNRTISGYVYDDQGDALPGVPICIDESRVCTVTDDRGYYTFKIPSQTCDLKFSYVGMKTQYVTVKSGSESVHQNVTMESNTLINEVVITGYQEIQSSKMTGSTVTLNAEKLDSRYTANIINNLEGRVAGLSTYGGELKIRGTSSLYAETSPLLVIDGIPMEGKIDDINPYDIESINVLKDAAAAAIYGARASNGIIVITTKNAKKKGRIEIDFQANLTIKEKRNLDYHDNFLLNPSEQVDLENKAWDYVFNVAPSQQEGFNPIANTEQAIALGTSEISPLQYAWYQRAKGDISQTQFDQVVSQLKQNNFAKEYGDAVLRQQVMQQYNLSLRSRSDKFQSNLTLNYKHDNEGMIKNGSSSFNVNYKGSYDVTKWLTASVTINGVFDKSKGYGNDYQIGSRFTPFAFSAYDTMYDTDGSLRSLHTWFDGSRYTPAWGEGLEDTGFTFIDELNNNTKTTRRTHMRYHGDLLFRIIDGLTANAQFIYERDHVNTLWYANQQSHAARMMKNAYSQLDPTTGIVSYLTPRSGGIRSDYNTEGQYWTARGQLNYAKTFGKHALNALAGLEFRETKDYGSRTLYLGYDDQLQNSSTQTVNFAALSQMTISPYFMAAGRGFPADQFIYDPYIDGNMSPVVEVLHRYGSGYANLTYTYDERYNVFGSWRKDYADVYGLNVKFRGKPLWSVGAGWLMHNEQFLKPVEWLNFLKLRVSYGVTGNIYQGASSYMTATSTGLNELTGLPYGEVQSPANPNLKWEQSRITNVGVDYSLFNNRLRGAVDYYRKVGKDIFSRITLDPTTGFSSMVANAASMVNKGVELQLTYDWLRPKMRKDISLTTNLTMAYNKNEVTKVENDATRAYQLIENPYREGYPTSALWSYQFAGISDEPGEQGMTLYYIEDGGKSTSAQGKSVDIMTYSGQSEPKCIIGLDNTIHWNGFSLSLLMAYYGGHKMRALPYDETFGGTGGPSYGTVARYFANAWTPENPTDMPGFGQYASTSTGLQTKYVDRSVHDASFLKIRNIVLGYDFDPAWIKSLGMTRLGLRFQIDNMKALWTANDLGVDPETQGIRNPASFIFGLNVNF